MSLIPVFVSQMQEADRRAINKLGIPGAVLMYNAGKAVVDYIKSLYPDAESFAVFAGKGNNAGDGFVIGHLLKNMKKQVSILCTTDQYTGDAKIYFDLCKNERIPISVAANVSDAVKGVKELSNSDLLIDCLLGTGLKSAVREPIASMIAAIPDTSNVLSVDLPSGMDGDTGEPLGCCVKAHHTITLAAPKIGMKNRPDLTGRVHIADIGMPDICLSDSFSL